MDTVCIQMLNVWKKSFARILSFCSIFLFWAEFKECRLENSTRSYHMEGEAVCMHIIHPSIKRVIECTRGTTTSDEGHARASERAIEESMIMWPWRSSWQEAGMLCCCNPRIWEAPPTPAKRRVGVRSDPARFGSVASHYARTWSRACTD